MPVNIVHNFTQIGQNEYFLGFVWDEITFCWPKYIFLLIYDSFVGLYFCFLKCFTSDKIFLNDF